MSRKSPVPQVDIDLGKRLAQLRQRRHFSREDVERNTGVNAGIIKRVELGRVPLTYRDARFLLSRFAGGPWPEIRPISPIWLAFGEGLECLTWPLFLPTNEFLDMPGRASFVDFAQAHTRLLVDLALQPESAYIPESWLGPYLSEWSQVSSKTAILESGNRMIERVFLNSCERLAPKSAEAVRHLKAYEESLKLEGQLKKALTNVSVSVKQRSMKRLFPSFLERLNVAASQRGVKSALASRLKVPLASVSQWLSGERKPGGETTLKLLQWVEKREQELQDSPGSALTPPGPKTRKRKSSDEKPRSSPEG